ncbi:hypothetical protein AXK56_16535 [Tsukamurella pulmonis]|uniref:Transposase n=1 Tax=Tsukamurella pulmonis TaxID=47312 RepID=A0A1H1A9H7_9ACTN|nr:DUF6262 family protein [Tsukamurella pulmonis]KXO95817.1 hypothetical protein AXK56_16535 [Tsukamurella pulmonis]SDQ36307.1 hypothetical protein SAMN04489765_0117 [Tsukamurella pulmonis]SUQ39420.1 Uncharacterised protein [Tsukamurella pulmonis]
MTNVDADDAADAEGRGSAAYEGLLAYASDTYEATARRIDQARLRLKRARKPVNISTVAEAAGLSRATIYRHPEQAAKIRAQRSLGTASPAEVAPPATADNSIIAGLRNQLRMREEEIAQLRRTVRERNDALAIAHAEIERLTP